MCAGTDPVVAPVLHETQELALNLQGQGKLLRFMQDGSYYRVGASTHRQSDIRFVAATNADLDKLIAKGQFRKDLYYRIRGGWLHLPPLRERKEDIPLLLRAFIKAENIPLKETTISDEAMNCLMRFDFPGNVRELKSIILSALNLAQGASIQPNHLPPHLLEKKSTTPPDCLMAGRPTSTLAEVEREHIICMYQQTGRNKSKTARVLGIGLNTLRRKLSTYGLS